MTGKEFPDKTQAFSLSISEPKSSSVLSSYADPDLRAHVKSIRDEGEAYFARLLEEHATTGDGTPKRDNEYRNATHRSSLFDPHTHSHVIFAAPPEEEKP